MNAEDLELFENPCVYPLINNYENIMEDPLIQRLLDLYRDFSNNQPNTMNQVTKSYWVVLSRAFRLLDTLPAIYTARNIYYKFSMTPLPFTRENIERLFRDVAFYLSADNLLKLYQKHKDNLIIKECAHGGIEITTDIFEYKIDPLMSFANILCTLQHDDWLKHIAENQIFTPGSKKFIGSSIEKSVKDDSACLTMDKKTAEKFKQITGWSAV